MSFSTGRLRWRIAVNYTAEMEGGKGSSRGNQLPSKTDYSSGAELGPWSLLPSQKSSFVLQRPGIVKKILFVYREVELTSTSSRRCSVIRYLRLQLVLFVYSRARSLLTPVTGAWWVLLRPVKPAGAVPRPFAGLTPGRVWSTGWWVTRHSILLLRHGLWYLDYCRRAVTAVQHSSFREGSIDLQASVWAGSAGQQRVHDSRPLSDSFPSLSTGTSHLPRRQSREGFGGGLLKSGWGEAKSRDVISWEGGSQILSGVRLGRLIKPPDFRVVPAITASRILIGWWDGMLCHWRGGKAWGMLHWGTVDSRRLCWKLVGPWPRPGLLPASRIIIWWAGSRGQRRRELNFYWSMP